MAQKKIKITDNNESDLNLENDSNQKIRYNYEKKEVEFIPDQEESGNFQYDLIKYILVIMVTALLLSYAFKYSNLNFFKSFSMYLFTLGGIALFLGSINALYSESPTLQLMRHRNADKVQIRKSSSSLTLLIVGVVVIILSFVINYIFLVFGI